MKYDILLFPASPIDPHIWLHVFWMVAMENLQTQRWQHETQLTLKLWLSYANILPSLGSCSQKLHR